MAVPATPVTGELRSFYNPFHVDPLIPQQSGHSLSARAVQKNNQREARWLERRRAEVGRLDT